MTTDAAGIGGYFGAFSSALTALDRIFEVEGPWVKRHELINHVLSEALEKLTNSFRCWELKCRFADAFAIDASESGFPLYRHVLELEDDAGRASAGLTRLPEPERIRADMLDMLMKHKRFPGDLQRSMAERLYFETLLARPLFLKSSQPHTIRHAFNKNSGRPVYVVYWSIYDGSANLPLIYMVLLEDSSNEGMTAFNNTRQHNRATWHRPQPGLPNQALATRFAEFAQTQCGYGLSLTTIAMALDKDFEQLHPKQVRRFVVGPFYAGGVTEQNARLQSVLDGVERSQNNWILTWTIQDLHSKVERPGRWGLFGRSAPQEEFYINTEDLDCAQLGLSAMERHALVPHEAYQAAYAQGRADDMLSNYRCYIVSGDDVLKHV
jgi:hypothetical protein